MAADSSERGTEARRTAAGRGRHDRAQGLASDTEAHEASHGRRCGTGGRAARSLLHVPWIACSAAEPHVSHGKRAQRELGDQDGPSLLQSLYDCGVVGNDLIFVRPGAPRRAVLILGQKILRAPGNPVQGAAVDAAGDLRVRAFGLPHRQLFGRRNQALQLVAVALQAVQVHPCEVNRRYLARANQFCQISHRPECGLLEISGPLHTGTPSPARWPPLQRGSTARKQRVEEQGRMDVVGDRYRVEVLIGLQVPVEAVEHQLTLFVGELETGQHLGVSHHVLGDLSRFLNQCPQGGR